jgi:hypothetical protein
MLLALMQLFSINFRKVSFFDHNKVILSEEGQVVTYIDTNRTIYTYLISDLFDGKHPNELSRLKYTKEILRKLVDQRRNNC